MEEQGASGRPPYAASTIRQRATELRLAASTLARAMEGPEHVTSLATVVTPARVTQVLDGFTKDNGYVATRFVRTLMKALFAVAQDWVHAPEVDLERLRTLQRKLAKGSRDGGDNTLGAQARALVRRLHDARTLRRVLGVPAALLDEVQRAPGRLRRHTVALRSALAVEILLHTGLRLHELASLRRRDLAWHDGDDVLRIAVAATDSMQAREFEISGPACRFVARCLDDLDARRREGRETDWLFADDRGRRVTDAALADGIVKASRRLLGFPITASAWRHVDAIVMLAAGGNNLVRVKDLLGHKFIATTEALYGNVRDARTQSEWHEHLMPPPRKSSQARVLGHA
jgi:integrase